MQNEAKRAGLYMKGRNRESQLMYKQPPRFSSFCASNLAWAGLVTMMVGVDPISYAYDAGK
jgi:hypothetical protein